MTAFGEALQHFTAKVETRSSTVFLNTVSAVHESITQGSPVTGSPGQPVGQYGPGYHEGDVGGELLSSWQTILNGQWSAAIVTNNPYAPQNEDGIARPGGGAYTQRSTVGGRHSVMKTAAGIQRLVDAEVKKVNP
jgi:hypothetical protein